MVPGQPRQIAREIPISTNSWGLSVIPSYVGGWIRTMVIPDQPRQKSLGDPISMEKVGCGGACLSS
jgi:hypothetical protein